MEGKEEMKERRMEEMEEERKEKRNKRKKKGQRPMALRTREQPVNIILETKLRASSAVLSNKLSSANFLNNMNG